MNCSALACPSQSECGPCVQSAMILTAAAVLARQLQDPYKGYHINVCILHLKKGCSMKAYLVFPDHRAARQSGYRRSRTSITWTEDHPLSLFGLGVLLDEYGHPFEWLKLRFLHHRTVAYLETSDPIKVMRALGLFAGEIHNLSDYIRPLNQSSSSHSITTKHPC